MDVAFTSGAWDWKPPRGVLHPSRREVLRALDAMPPDLGWEWARDRVVPVLERPGKDPIPENPQLSAMAACGISYGFGIDIGAAFTRVTQGLS